ncbi:cobalamin biosynthesis protein CbiX [Streptacidiphilus pinicola]|uniref:cobalamin biosynthesis protein CbiX n=1 Tax=Streptacidiphilus pinicola TaxID=2219663 RepID=UPI001A9CD473|nr:cobalamin biosynthesis protein CbiX [Streptacidiphilus pinicola]
MGPAGVPATLVLVGGHESVGAQELRPLVERGTAFRAVTVGRELTRAVMDALTAVPERPVCVVPMTLGRDPRLVADAARALRWLTRERGADVRRGDHRGADVRGGDVRGGKRIALTEPFGSAGHLVGWLRAATGRACADLAADPTNAVATDRPSTGAPGPDAGATAVLLTAPAAGPFEDAELFRVARLVRQYGAHRWVEVAFHGGDPDLANGVDRCRRLGAARVLLVPAGFAPAAPTPTSTAAVVDGGPLLTPYAVAGVLTARTQEALRRLREGDDGIADGLDAEHGHGYAHTHAATEPHRHHHSHDHDQHGRLHPHRHEPGATSPTGNAHAHTHSARHDVLQAHH